MRCAVLTLAMVAIDYFGGHPSFVVILMTGIGCTIIALTEEVDEVKPNARWDHNPLRLNLSYMTCGECGRAPSHPCGMGHASFCPWSRDRLAELELAERFNRESG